MLIIIGISISFKEKLTPKSFFSRDTAILCTYSAAAIADALMTIAPNAARIILYSSTAKSTILAKICVKNQNTMPITAASITFFPLSHITEPKRANKTPAKQNAGNNIPFLTPPLIVFITITNGYFSVFIR